MSLLTQLFYKIGNNESGRCNFDNAIYTTPMRLAKEITEVSIWHAHSENGKNIVISCKLWGTGKIQSAKAVQLMNHILQGLLDSGDGS